MIVRLILWAVFGFIIYTIVKAAMQAFRAPGGSTPPEKSRGGETMERAPQCGTFVARSEAVEATLRGKTRWFCSVRCRDEFLHHHKH